MMMMMIENIGGDGAHTMFYFVVMIYNLFFSVYTERYRYETEVIWAAKAKYLLWPVSSSTSIGRSSSVVSTFNNNTCRIYMMVQKYNEILNR